MFRKETCLTPQGLKQLQEEMDNLKGVRRREVAEQIRKASENGGNVGNAECDDAKSRQGSVEGRIREVESILANAVVAAHDKHGGMVDIGSSVAVEDSNGRKQRYKLVGSAEASPLEGKISDVSPVGKALMKRSAGQEIRVETPRGQLKYRILKLTS